jgi:hypothetical protein
MKSSASGLIRRVSGVCAVAALVSACGIESADPSATGDLRVVLEPEATITEGVAAGEDVENIRDGWTANYERFLAVLGDVHATSVANPKDERRDDRVIAVDLTQLPTGGKSLWELDGLPAGRWQFGYAVLGAEQAEVRDKSVSKADFDTLQAERWSYLFAVQLSKPEGQSCPPPSLVDVPTGISSVGENNAGVACYANPNVHLELGARAVTHYGPCERDGMADFSIPAGGTKTVAATLHGDHLFFNGFPEGTEGGIHRFAQWIADSDLNLDGEVTPEELKSITVSQLAEFDDRYQTGGAPFEYENMFEYIVAQLMTQGHFEGEGECQLSDIEY